MSKFSIILAWQSMPPEMVRVLRPITNRVQYREVLGLARQLWDQAETEAGLDTLLELLTERLQTYEDRRFPIPDPSPAEAVRFLMDQRSLTQEELAQKLGIHQTTLSRLLSGSRRPTARQASALAAYFKVDPSLFFAAA
jgi:HTH-type transcriptional regulator/antitoxin HigA